MNRRTASAPRGPLRLTREFYDRSTLAVAADLLGKVLVHRSPQGLTAGVIVEAEAYIGEEDPACHAAPGPTPRNQPLYGPPGFAYVYLNYGIHFLFNVVTEAEGHPAAVLIRGLDPIDGLPLMRRRRAKDRDAPIPDSELCRGPGNLSRAMGITLRDNRTDLCGDVLYIEDRGLEAGEIEWSPRIGIRVGTETHWRCYVRGAKGVSGRRSR